MDVDGSQMTVTIEKSGYGTYQVEYYDDGASACGKDAFGEPRYAGRFNTIGRPSGSTLLLSEIEMECVGLSDFTPLVTI